MCNTQSNSYLPMFSIQKGLPIFALIALFCSTTLVHGQGINISDTISVDYNSVSGSSDIQWVGFHAGENKFAYSINVAVKMKALLLNMRPLFQETQECILMFNLITLQTIGIECV